MQSKRKNTALFVFLGVVGLVLLTAVASIIDYRLHRENQNTLVFTDPKHSDEAEILFTIKNGLIQFDGNIAGRTVPVVLDTGAANSSVPMQWRIPSKPFAKAFTFLDGGNNRISAIPVLFPSLHLPGCDILNYTALELSVPSSKSTLKRISVRDHLVLGNSALVNSIITVNYQKRTLTLSSAKAVTDYSHVVNTGVKRFSWDTADSRHNLYAPLLYGTVQGHPITMIVDTGSAKSIYLSRALFAALLKTNRNRAGLSHTAVLYEGGCSTQRTIKQITVTIDRHSLNGALESVCGQAVAVEHIPGTASAVIGTDMFRNDVMTIDYPRHIITFSPSK